MSVFTSEGRTGDEARIGSLCDNCGRELADHAADREGFFCPSSLADRFCEITGMPRGWAKVVEVIRCDGCACIFHPDDEGEAGPKVPRRCRLCGRRCEARS